MQSFEVVSVNSENVLPFGLLIGQEVIHDGRADLGRGVKSPKVQSHLNNSLG